MIVGVASYKGGVGKTTTAVHLAAYLQRHHGPTLLLDGDSTRNATNWASHRDEADGAFPFRVAYQEQAGMLSRNYEHLVYDTGQKPTDNDLLALASGCDVVVVPSVPSFLEMDGLGQTIRALKSMAAPNFRVLLTSVPHFALVRARELRNELMEAGVPLFTEQIPRLTAFEKAVAIGRTVEEVDDPQALRAWQAYEDVGAELSARMSPSLREAAL